VFRVFPFGSAQGLSLSNGVGNTVSIERPRAAGPAVPPYLKQAAGTGRGT
jgi:hypothetical protein